MNNKGQGRAEGARLLNMNEAWEVVIKLVLEGNQEQVSMLIKHTQEKTLRMIRDTPYGNDTMQLFITNFLQEISAIDSSLNSAESNH